MDMRDRLQRIELEELIVVPEHLARYIENREALDTLEGISLYGEGQRTLRLIAPNVYTHEERDQIGEAVLGPANPYYLCRIPKFQLDSLSPEDKLKILGILGQQELSLGLPVAIGPTQKALAPEDWSPAPTGGYQTAYIKEKLSDLNFLLNLRRMTDDPEHKERIEQLRVTFMGLKYPRPVGWKCGMEVTPETHRILPLSVVDYWEEHKPEGYRQRDGSAPVVWNCK